MRYISFDLLLKALKEQGLDGVYEKLYNLFMEDGICIIDQCGMVVYAPMDLFDLWDYLEDLYLNKLNKEVERHEE